MGATDQFKSPPFAELSIGCERCHGPGGKHAELPRSGNGLAESDTIVNPAKLDPSRRDAVCYQCHLLGQERVLQYGRTDFDFRPGMHLGDVWAVLVEGTGVTDEGTEAVSQAEQMLASRCYEASNGKLGCISCHDPHYSPAPAERREFYRTRCLTCHSERSCLEVPATRQQTEGDSCIACHAPPLNASDVPHTSQTDHRVLRRPLLRQISARAAANPDDFRIFEAETPGLTSRAERRARGILLAMLAERQHDARLAARVERQLEPYWRAAPDDVAVGIALAQVAALQQRPTDAAAHWKAVLAVDPRNETALQALASLAAPAVTRAENLAFLERYLALNPWEAAMHVQRSRLLGESGRKIDALAAARQALELDPSRTETYDWLATLCARCGRADEARGYVNVRRRLQQDER
jgi:predicted CXXCH cytochrome family protein